MPTSLPDDASRALERRIELTRLTEIHGPEHLRDDAGLLLLQLGLADERVLPFESGESECCVSLEDPSADDVDAHEELRVRHAALGLQDRLRFLVACDRVFATPE